MALGKTVARALSFAHLAGLSRAEEPKKDDQYCEEEDPKDQDKENINSKAEGSDDDEKKQREGESDEDYAKRMEEDDKSDKEMQEDDSDEEMRGSSAAASARRRERARCAAIFASKSAAKNPALAANLAFNTALPRHEALAVLASTPVASSINADRASRNPSIALGGEMVAAKSVPARWDAAFKKVNRR